MIVEWSYEKYATLFFLFVAVVVLSLFNNIFLRVRDADITDIVWEFRRYRWLSRQHINRPARVKNNLNASFHLNLKRSQQYEPMAPTKHYQCATLWNSSIFLYVSSCRLNQPSKANVRCFSCLAYICSWLYRFEPSTVLWAKMKQTIRWLETLWNAYVYHILSLFFSEY